MTGRKKTPVRRATKAPVRKLKKTIKRMRRVDKIKSRARRTR